MNDAKKFRNGENQLVSDNGNDLSGGQKSRINLARALYNDAQIYLFDNPLSAYDKNVAKFIREELGFFLIKKSFRMNLFLKVFSFKIEDA